jgi:hypothetical protein
MTRPHAPVPNHTTNTSRDTLYGREVTCSRRIEVKQVDLGLFRTRRRRPSSRAKVQLSLKLLRELAVFGFLPRFRRLRVPPPSKSPEACRSHLLGRASCHPLFELVLVPDIGLQVDRRRLLGRLRGVAGGVA